ncbi:reverse transcriptase domain-containing protein, partial [Salmonella enterica subsp. enterica serovar Corvallis]
ALEPVSETTADRNSYGFRPMRSTADAIEQCFVVLSRGNSAQWVLEGDIKGCFDNISHDWLLAHIPMDKQVLGKWLKAGYMESGHYHTTGAGTPQGGIISPILANMALDGLEAVLESRFGVKNTKASYKTKVNYVRYADDFIITGISQELLENEVKPLVEAFMAERGLQLSPEKTVIT